MPTPETADLSVAKINTQSHSRGSAGITGIVSVTGVALLSLGLTAYRYFPQSSDEPPSRKQTNALVAERLKAEIAAQNSRPEVDIETLRQQLEAHLEVLRTELSTQVTVCADNCAGDDCVKLAAVFLDCDVTGEKVHKGLADVPEPVKVRIHSIGKILHDCPELAPEVLTFIREYLGRQTDGRQHSLWMIPKTSKTLSDTKRVRDIAGDFLRLEEETGSYRPPETAKVASVKKQNTMISESSTGKSGR